MKKNPLLIPAASALLILSACSGDNPPAPAASQVHADHDAAQDLEQAKEMTISTDRIMKAALEGSSGIIDEALAAGFGVDTRDEQERTMLMYAAFNSHSGIVKKLLDAGADVNARDWTGTTALMFAASGPDTQTVQLLLDAEADVNAVDENEHFSALMWAAAEGQLKNVKLLLKNGADPTLKDVDGDTAASFAAQRDQTAIVELLKDTAGN